MRNLFRKGGKSRNVPILLKFLSLNSNWGLQTRASELIRESSKLLESLILFLTFSRLPYPQLGPNNPVPALHLDPVHSFLSLP